MILPAGKVLLTLAALAAGGTAHGQTTGTQLAGADSQGASSTLSATTSQNEDARITALERQLAEQQQRIEQLEAIIMQQAGYVPTQDAQLAVSSSGAAIPPVSPPAIAAATPPAYPAMPVAPDLHVPGLDLSGDLRVRQEWNNVPGRNRTRSAVRARLQATYRVDDSVTIGARVATGSSDDPNSTDVTLGSFLDDFPLSLDRAWIGYTEGDFTAQAGKFALPFKRTDMVWDGDVSPQGVSLSWSAQAGGAALSATGLYFIVDEAATGPDSDMLGGQATATFPVSPSLTLGLTGSYYHYRLGSLDGADTGDFRGNIVRNGAYLSDFHLVEGLATLDWDGLAPKWPVSATANYVHNAGAAVSGDSGFTVGLAAGQVRQTGDFRLAYHYSEVGVDAVLAAFSHDNIDLSTNYRLHEAGLSFVPAAQLRLDLLWYRYQQLDAAFAASPNNAWLERVRLGLSVEF